MYTVSGLIIYYKGPCVEVPDLLEPRSSKDGVAEKPSGEEEKELETGRATEKNTTNTPERKV